MGLFFQMDIVRDLGFPEETPILGIIPNYSRGCEIFKETFLAWANELVPVDTGYLQSTLTSGYENGRVYCETQCEYAQYPEYGTWCQPAQPYFKPAIEIALKQAFPEWINAYNEAKQKEQHLIDKSKSVPDFNFENIFLVYFLLQVLVLMAFILAEVFFENMFNTAFTFNNGGIDFSMQIPDIMII